MVVWTSEFTNEFVLVTILTLFQIIGLYFAVRVKLILGKARFWDFIIIALGLMFFRRAILFLNLLGVSYFSAPFFYKLDTIYLPLLTWLLLAMAFFELYLKVKNGKTFSSKKKTVRTSRPRKTVKKRPKKRKSLRRRIKTSKTARKAIKQQTQPSKIQRFFARKTEDGYIDMTG